MSYPHLPAPRSVSGSALVLVLLITALLTTIVVSFFSTARIEQLAARNLTQKEAATALAKTATHLAMSSIELGFNTTGNLSDDCTAIVTTQPGAIHKFFFQHGTVTQNTTVQLFSSGNLTISANSTALARHLSNKTININNLSNPQAANATGLTLTGNASEQINVRMENVLGSDGTLVGRIAYYVDDEGTKLNLNAATGDRPTLNIASSRSLSLSSVADTNQSTAFTQVITGNGTSGINATSDVRNWVHFFRPEQIVGALSGFDPNILALLSATTSGGVDAHIKKTPWGTQRLFINDLPIDSSGVDAIYEALSGKNATTGNYSASPNQYEIIGQKLRDIYGSTFSEKYTDAGLKQIAANILQARDHRVLNDWNKSFSYNGSLLGASNSTTDLVKVALRDVDLDGDGVNETQTPCCSAVKQVIPKHYLGNVPYPILNEIGVTITFGFADDYMRLYIRPFVSVLNPFRVPFTEGEVGNWRIDMQIDSVRYDVTHRTADGTVLGPFTYGPTGYKNRDAFGHTLAEGRNQGPRNAARQVGQLEESYSMGGGFFSYTLNGSNSTFGERTFTNPSESPSYKIELKAGEELQFPCPPFHNTRDVLSGGGVQFKVNGVTGIVDISNIIIKFEYIRLTAKSNDDTTIRDWVLAQDLEVEGWLQAPLTQLNTGPVSWPQGFPEDLTDPGFLALKALPGSANRKWVRREDTKPPQISIKRLDGRLKTTAKMAQMLEEMCPCGSGVKFKSCCGQKTDQMMAAWSKSGPASWVDPNASGRVTSNLTIGNPESYPSTTAGNEIPGDPVKADSDPQYSYDPADNHLETNDWPRIEFTNAVINAGVFTSPADLGKIQTNIQHRKLRMTTQHPNEVHTVNGGNGNATYKKNPADTIMSPLSYIPDWAMLDVISFGTNSTTSNYAAPAAVNLNGGFHLPANITNTSPPSARTVGVVSALKAIESADLLGNSFNASITLPTNRSQYIGGGNRVTATVAENISNLTWSSGNFTAGNATWGVGNASADPGSRRKMANFPLNQFVLPAEVTEIRGVSDVVPLDSYTSSSINIKANEGCLSSLFPGATTQSRFFTIYAYAEAGRLMNKNLPESESNPFIPESDTLTKTLVQVEDQTPATIPPTYKVKKLHSQNLPLGE